KAARGDASGALERFSRCVEVFERYPGVCRCMLNWCHIAHGVLGSLAAIDDSRGRGLYDRLREVYNRWRHSASLPAPRLEEWRGISAICNDFQCGLYDGAIASFSAFSIRPHGTSSCTPDSFHGTEFGSCRFGTSWKHRMPLPRTRPVRSCLPPCCNHEKPMAATSL
ncbi:unnamed protein product, partial [Ectocarpus fasciculatus]